MWLIEFALNATYLNLGSFIVERMKGTCHGEKISLAYGNIITSLVRKKGIWSLRYQVDKVKNKDQPISFGWSTKNGIQTRRRKFMKTPKDIPRNEDLASS